MVENNSYIVYNCDRNWSDVSGSSQWKCPNCEADVRWAAAELSILSHYSSHYCSIIWAHSPDKNFTWILQSRNLCDGYRYLTSSCNLCHNKFVCRMYKTFMTSIVAIKNLKAVVECIIVISWQLAVKDTAHRLQWNFRTV